MGKKRSLNRDELSRCAASIKRLEDEQGYHKYLEKYCDLMLAEGLEQNFKLQVRDFIGKKRDALGHINEIKSKIDTLKDQIKYGVEIKQKGDK